MPPRLVSVAVPVPGVDLLTYSVPDDIDGPARGARVLVPLGARIVTGCVTALDPADPRTDPATARVDVRPLVDVLDATAFLPDAIVDLTLWVADYYLSAPGEAVACAMPPRAWVVGDKVVRVTDAGRSWLDEHGPRGHAGVLLGELAGSAARRMSAIRAAGGRSRRGVHALVAALERDGFVTVSSMLAGRAEAFRTAARAVLTEPGREVAARAPHDRPRLGRIAGLALDRLSSAPGGLSLAALDDAGVSADVVRRLKERGLVAVCRDRVERDPFGADSGQRAFEASAARPGGGPALSLTNDQARALARLEALLAEGRYRTALLYGVTGSGKTELYLRLARAAHRIGRSALVLVPEIALTPATAAAFRAAFGDRVAIQHSALSDGERYDQWHRIRAGRVDVVVGTRSAVFAPLASLGLVVVDEEHDASYKQEESPRYNARDVAVVRAREAGALVVLGSATPSLESLHNARRGRYELVTMDRRVADRPLAAVRVVDMRAEYAARGPRVIVSGALEEAIRGRLAGGEQALVLLNRRGYATAIFCRQCAGSLECPNCSVSLTVHRAARRARCHYCNHSTGLPRRCARCGGEFLELTGFGTERVEAEVRRLVPEARVARLDRDTVRRKHALGALLARFARAELDVLVGTQMIAKGHDFPGVTLVGVISADVGLGLADFRAAERTFQLLTQVVGRAGRGDKPGEAIIQTLHPGHYGIVHACRQDAVAFFDKEMEFRQAMRYPPTVALVNLVVRAQASDRAMTIAATLVDRLRAASNGYRVLGPAPAPLSRLRGEHRAQCFLKGTSRTRMRAALREVLASLSEGRRQVMVDVDPMTVL